jgi:hypothetical protein
MRLKRLLLACVISLGVSLQGFASVIAIEAPCPIAHAAADSGTHAAMHDEESADCCGDAATPGKSGKLCNMGAACHVEGQALQTAVALLKIVPVSVTVFLAPSLDPASWDPSYVWRPPALI